MTRVRRRVLHALIIAALAVGAGTAGSNADQPASIVAAKSCGSGYTHAVLPNGHKCLRAGQYCKKAWDSRYHKYGFHCHGQRLKKR
jgi:hypothetical protein